ncbi:hypothetical protein, partial [Kitasatospora sp. NPDC001175]
MKTRAAGLVVSGLTSFALVVLGGSPAHAHSDWTSDVMPGDMGTSNSPWVDALLGQAGTEDSVSPEMAPPEEGAAQADEGADGIESQEFEGAPEWENRHRTAGPAELPGLAWVTPRGSHCDERCEERDEDHGNGGERDEDHGNGGERDEDHGNGGEP